MKTYLHNLKWMTAFTLLLGTFASCEEAEVEGAKLPVVSNVKVESITGTAAEVSLAVENASELFYDLAEGMKVIVEGEAIEFADGAAKFTLVDLDYDTDYEVSVYAVNAEGGKSASVEASFTTLAYVVTPEILSLETNVVGKTSVSFNAELDESSKIVYTVTCGADVVCKDVEVAVVDNAASFEVKDLQFETEYSLSAVAYAASGEESEAKVVPFSTLEAGAAPTIVSAEATSKSFDSASFSVKSSDAAKIFYSIDGITEAPVEVDVVDNISMFSVEGLKGETEYTLVVTAINEDEIESVEPFEYVFTTDAAPAIYVSGTSTSPFSVSVDFELAEGTAIAVLTQQTLSYSEDNFTMALMYGYATIITESKKYTAQYDFSNYPVTPGNSYTVAYVEAVDTGETDYMGNPTYAMKEDAEFHKVELTPEIKFNEYNQSVKLAQNNDATGLYDLTATVYRNEGDTETTKFYITAVKASEFTSGEDVFNGEYFASNGCDYLATVDYTGTASEYLQEVDIKISGLEMNTEYKVAAIPISPDNQLGEITVCDMSTKDLVVKPELTAVPTFTPSTKSISISFELAEGVEKAYYEYRDASIPYADDDIAFKSLYNTINSPYGTQNYATPDKTEIKLENLAIDKQYLLYVLTVDAEGNFGEIKEYEMATNPLVFDSSITMECTKAKEDLQTTSWGYSFYVYFDVKFGDKATSFVYGSATLNTDLEQAEAEQAYASAVVSSAWKDYTASDFDAATGWFKQQIYGATKNVLVFVPKDADGNYGTPTYFYPSDWEADFSQFN